MREDSDLWSKAADHLAAELEGSPHPSPEDLCAFVDRALGEEQCEQIREHMVGCSECRQIVLDLEGFPALDPAGESFRLDEAAMEEEWRALESRRLAEEMNQPSSPQPELKTTAVVRRPGANLFLHAALLMTSLGLLIWGQSQSNERHSLTLDIQALEEQIESLQKEGREQPDRRPPTLANLLSFAPATGSVRGPSSPSSELVVPSAAEGILWVLEIAEDHTEGKTYRFELIGADGSLLFARGHLIPIEDETVTLSMPRDVLLEGDLTIRLQTEDAEESLNYPIRIQLESEQPQ